MSLNIPNAYQIPQRQHPSQGSKCIERLLGFTGAITQILGDTLLEIEGGHIDFFQSILVNNALNNSPLSLYFPGIGADGHTLYVPANTVILSPIYAPIGKLTYIATSVGAVTVPILLFNIEQPYFSYSVAAAKAAIVTGTTTNHSGNSTAANVSQIAIPANPNRLRAVIQNPQANNASFWISEGTGNAAVESNFSQEIAPGQQYDTANGPLQLGDINIISAVLNQTYFAQEIHS